jgi:NHLM bacteriocin system ABC transporter ATP-binding protein
MNALEQLIGEAGGLDALLAADWAAPAGPLALALGNAGARRVVGGHDVIELARPGRGWLVLSGTVDLFLADAQGRFPVTRIEAGGLIGALPVPEDGSRAIGVPAISTEILEIDGSALARLAADPQVAQLLDEALRGWRDALAEWLPARGGETAPEVRAEPNLVHDVLAAVVAARQAEREARLSGRTRDRHATERALSAGLGAIAQAIGTARARLAVERVETVAEAARLVLRHDGLDASPPRRLPAEAAQEAIAEIAVDNGLQYRAVGLGDTWWSQDIGPLVGGWGPQEVPCALLPEGGRIVAHGPDGPVPIGPGNAAMVGTTAYAFYRPLPQADLSRQSLLSFALRGRSGDIAVIGVTLLVAGLIAFASPILLGWLMDPIIPDADRSQAVVVTAFLVLLGIGATTGFIVETLASLRIQSVADNRVQAALWIRLLNLPPSFFRSFTAGDLAARAGGLNAVWRLLSQSLTTFASAAATLLFSLVLMAWYSWKVTVVVLLATILFGACAYLVGRRVIGLNFESLELAGRTQGIVLQLVGAIAKLRMAGAEKLAFLRWLSVYRGAVDLNLQQRRLANRLVIARSAFDPLVIATVLVVLGLASGDLLAIFRADNERVVAMPLMGTADFVAFNLALGQAVGAMLAMTRGLLFLAMMKPHLERVWPILEAPEEPKAKGARLGRLRGEIELRDVRFRYAPDAPLALKGLSMRIPEGRFVAIVGASGAGKSSVIRLLLGFDVPESGAVHVDGTDMRLLDVHELRQRYGVVLQNGRLLAGSLYDNVACGLPFSDEQVLDALGIAQLADFVAALPMGLRTSIADGGVSLSGGQRQRILLARAIIRRPRVLLLDEATSALDNVTQDKVVAGLRSLNCTQIVVAQRFSTITSADLIHVIEDGRVVESGSYLELLAKGTRFRAMAERQML